MNYTYDIDHRFVGTLTLNRPKVHNAFNEELIVELTEFFLKKIQKDSLRLVVLTGSGKSFCAGADITWMKKMIDYSNEENFQDSLALSKLFQTIDTCPVPVLGKIQGAALGGGAGLVSVCDCAIASSEAVFGFTEVRLGLIPAVIGPYVMAKIGQTHARATFLSGERFDAHRAKEWGLVHEICPPQELDKFTETKIEQFLKAGLKASAAAKTLIRRVVHAKRDDLQEITCRMIADIRISSEAQEGMSALLEKRKPHWMKKCL